MLHNLVVSLVKHERINTTLAKAKEIRGVAERLITYGKRGSVHHRRLAFKILHDRTLVKKVFDELVPKYNGINGGYTRVLKNGFRKGDAASMAIIEFVEGKEISSKEEQIKTQDIAE